MTVKPILGIVGAGKVGSVAARLLYNVGYRVCAVYSPTHSHAARLAAAVNAVVTDSAADVMLSADLTLLTVPDDAIKTVAAGLQSAAKLGKGVVHTSGAHDASDLDVLAQFGVMTGSLHPAFPFSDVEMVAAGLQGAVFAVEAEDALLRAWLNDIVWALGGYVMDIPSGGKVTYHLALAMASNFTVTLYAIAETLLLGLGIEPDAARVALNALVGATVENLRTQGVPKAMIGPLTRADVGTITAHLDVLHRADPRLLQVYRDLARLSYPMLVARGIAIEKIENVLRQDEDDAVDNS